MGAAYLKLVQLLHACMVTAVHVLYHLKNLIVRLFFSISGQVLHFCMWNFVFGNTANRALFPETKFHIQKYDGLENIDADVVIVFTQPDRRKSKFGLRYSIKLYKLYGIRH